MASQHFQGLRRAQNKVDTSNGTSGDGNSKQLDPTLNPITRRPGPGRGRPRKQPPAPVAGDATAPGQTPQKPQDPQQLQQLQSLPPAPPAPMGPGEPLPQPVHLGVPDALGLEQGDELEEQAAKRQRLDDNTDPSLEDDAILNSLTDHQNQSSVDQYGQE